PVGLAYATWSGTGILMVSTLGILFYGQHPDTAAIIGMVIIASILFSKTYLNSRFVIEVRLFFLCFQKIDRSIGQYGVG
ncbi:SMR family transporter, partial [Escherichia coli]|uniref:SMR family transporter n=1 Tax=Escherichia coli TaxID=562 RepID=UPI003EDE96BC